MARRADKNDTEFLVQCRVLAKRWQGADPTAFGLTELEVDLFEARLLAALEARDLAREARNLARARFVGQREAIANLRSLFGALVGGVDVRAKREGPKKARSVYAAAGIRPPEKPGPLPTPAMPSDLESTIRTNGEIDLTFKMEDRGRGGLLYEVQRRLVPLDGDPSPWLPVDIIAGKRFTDDDVPTGLREVCYQVRAMRASGKRGDWSCAHIVRFGTVRSAGGAGGVGVVGGVGVGEHQGAVAGAMEAKPPSEGANRERASVKANAAG